jgi:hypothetical protein
MQVIFQGDEAAIADNFRHFWAKLVTGAKLEHHCARGLIGKYVQSIRPHMKITDGEKVCRIEGEFDFLYVCGVSSKKPYYHTNFHAVGRPKEGVSFQVETFNGVQVTFDGFEMVEIREVGEAWQHLSKAFTTCRNFQFAVEHYGEGYEQQA